MDTDAAPIMPCSVEATASKLIDGLTSQFSAKEASTWRCSVIEPPAVHNSQGEPAAHARLVAAVQAAYGKAGKAAPVATSIVRPHGARSAPVAINLFYPTPHNDPTILSLEPLTTRIFIRKGFQNAPRAFIWDSYPLKVPISDVKQTTGNPPKATFGLPAGLDTAVKTILFEENKAILKARSNFASLTLVYGRFNCQALLADTLQTHRSESLKTFSISIPVPAWQSRGIGENEFVPTTIHAYHSNGKVNGVFVELPHPSSGWNHTNRQPNIWHDGCLQDAFTNLACSWAGGSVPDRWAGYMMSGSHPSPVDSAAGEKEDFRRDDRVWLNKLRSLEQSGRHAEYAYADLPVHLRTVTDAAGCTEELFQSEKAAGRVKTFLELATRHTHPASSFYLDRIFAARSQLGAPADQETASAQDEWRKKAGDKRKR